MNWEGKQVMGQVLKIVHFGKLVTNKQGVIEVLGIAGPGRSGQKMAILPKKSLATVFYL